MTEDDDPPDELRSGSCSREDCPIEVGGSCAIGHGDPLDCEFYELTDVDDVEPEPVGPAQWTLPNGEALSTAELEAVTAEHPVSTVAPLGIVAAGKTTLICLLFDQVRTRREPAWKFTRSRTILGFARRSHDASFNSGRTVPTTPRTALTASGQNLHLGMRRAADDSQAPIVFVDLSGEHVQQFVSGKAVEAVAEAFRRADHIPVVINGEDIANPRTRQKAIMQGRALLARLRLQPLRPGAVVSLIVTKGDLLNEVDLDPILDDITAEYPIPGDRRFVTADREGEGVERGLGVHDLLVHLTTLPIGEAPKWETPTPPAPSPVLARVWGRG